MINLKIDPEFQSQIPPLTDDEFKQLEENILKEGKLLSPLIVWNNTLVDGHNRYAILQKHPEIYFSTTPLQFENREETIAWICRNQLGRRNLSPEQKRYLLGKQYEAEKKAAKIFMTIELIKQLLDACYLAKRAREMLPALPEGVTSSYIQCLDVIQKLQTRGIWPKISDLSDALNLPRPGVTRTVKEMEHKGYLRKQVSAEDGRVTYLFLTESGQALSQKYNTDYFSQLLPYLDGISEEDAACTIQTLEKFYAIMCERKDSLEKR